MSEAVSVVVELGSPSEQECAHASFPPRRQLLKALAHQDAYAVVFLSGSYWPGLTRGAW